MKTLHRRRYSMFPSFLGLALAALLLVIGPAHAANILWVSDNGTDNTFSDPGNYPDGGFITILQSAGHTVTRFNGPNDLNTRLTPQILSQINSYDLIILGRAVASAAFQSPQVIDWNVNVTKPLMTINAYLVRANRLGWCTGNTMLDDTPTPVRAVNLADPLIGYIFSEVAMNGNVTANPYDEPIHRNTSQILEGPVSGGRVLAVADFTDLGGVARNNIPVIMEWPAGTPVRGGADILGGYRMYFAASSREPATGGDILQHCVENLTATGESMFLKAVEIAANRGQLPFDPAAPVGFANNLRDVTVPEGTVVNLSVTVTGAPPRAIQWQKWDGVGSFTNIPGATSSTLALGTVNPPQDGQQFRVVATNRNGSATSAVARLTVIVDTNAPQVTQVTADVSMNQVWLFFSEPVQAAQAQNLNNYVFNPPLAIQSATLSADGRRLQIVTEPLTQGQRYTVMVVEGIPDRSYYTNWLAGGTELSFYGWVSSRGFLAAQRYFNLTGNDIASLITSPNYPNFWDELFYVNSAQTVQTVPNRDNYGGRLIGWLRPLESGFFTFFIRGDDGTELRLGSTADFSTLNTIAQQASANQPFTSGQSVSIFLEAGQRYALEALWKEGTGGDYVQVAWQPPSGTGPVIIPAEALEVLADPSAVQVAITTQPQGRTILQNRTHTFTVAAAVTPTNAPLVYTWQRWNGVDAFTNVAVVLTNSYTTRLLSMADDGSQWRVLVAAPGVVATSAVATVTVSQDAVPPSIVKAINSPGNPTAIIVEFDELVNRSIAEDPVYYAVTNLLDNSPVPVNDLIRPVLSADGRTVTLYVVSPLTNDTFYVVTAQAFDLVDNYATVSARIERTGLLTPGGPQNLVVMEAEDYDEMISRVWEGVERYWILVTNRAGYSGRGAMRAMPNTEGNRPSGNEATSLDFFVQFPGPGRYYVWVRGGAEGGADNSIHVGLNNVVPSSAQNVQQGYDLGMSGWHWGSISDTTGGRVYLDVPSAGVHRVQVYMREDGFYCDKIVLTTDLNYSPANVNAGLGPEPTVKQVSLPVLRLQAAPVTQGLQLRWPFIGTRLEQADNITGPWTPVPNATSPFVAPLTGERKFYRVVLP
ncbi:MAG: hypothetical protein N3J91_09580 [Verrucomicrobiae bacterium]|nr:hypothetical protein [Verrucomicrobiae bacterium]